MAKLLSWIDFHQKRGQNYILHNLTSGMRNWALRSTWTFIEVLIDRWFCGVARFESKQSFVAEHVFHFVGFGLLKKICSKSITVMTVKASGFRRWNPKAWRPGSGWILPRAHGPRWGSGTLIVDILGQGSFAWFKKLLIKPLSVSESLTLNYFSTEFGVGELLLMQLL